MVFASGPVISNSTVASRLGYSNSTVFGLRPLKMDSLLAPVFADSDHVFGQVGLEVVRFVREGFVDRAAMLLGLQVVVKVMIFGDVGHRGGFSLVSHRPRQSLI